jgi:hypothetical protein
MSTQAHLRLVIFLTIAASGCGGGDTATPPADQTATEADVRVVRTGLAPMTKGPLVIDPGGFELGIVPPSSAYQIVATLRNTSSAPITIITVKSSCMCTDPENLEGRVIGAGETMPFTTSFEGPATPGDKAAYVRLVFSQGGNTWPAAVKINATVALAVRSLPPYVDALKGVTRGQLQVESVDGQPFRILSAYGQEPVHADGFVPGRDEPRAAYMLNWNVEYVPGADCKAARYWWVLETDHPECPLLPVEIRHDCTGARRLEGARGERQWFYTEYLVNLGVLKAGAPVEADVEMQKFGGRKTLRVDAVESLTPDATAELVKADDSPESEFTICRVRFTPRPGFKGLLYADVMIRTETGDFDLPFIARVE